MIGKMLLNTAPARIGDRTIKIVRAPIMNSVVLANSETLTLRQSWITWISELILETKQRLKHFTLLTKVSCFPFIEKCYVFVDDTWVEVPSEISCDTVRHKCKEIVSNSRTDSSNLKWLIKVIRLTETIMKNCKQVGPTLPKSPAASKSITKPI